MEVIGVCGRDEYICKLNHSELEKYMNLYYGKMQNLHVGQHVYLGKGYDFLHKTESALKKTEEFLSANKEVIQAIMSGITVMTRKETQENKG